MTKTPKKMEPWTIVLIIWAIVIPILGLVAVMGFRSETKRKAKLNALIDSAFNKKQAEVLKAMNSTIFQTRYIAHGALAS